MIQVIHTVSAMKPDKRFIWGASVVAVIFFAAAFGVATFYNETHEARGLDRAGFQALFVALLALTLLAVLAATWAATTTRDEVASAADRVSVYWGWIIGTFIWCMTPWVSSLPEALAEPLSNPDGDTLFTLSEAAGAYVGGGFVLMLIVAACSWIIKVCWWLAKR